MVTIKRFPDTMTAHIARSILQEEGIDAFIADENLANADPPVVFASGGVRLQVPDEDAERAHLILKQMDGYDSLLELPDDFDPGDFDPAEKPAKTSSKGSGYSFGGMVVSFVFGALVMWAALKAWNAGLLRKPFPANESFAVDSNDDGIKDCTYFYQGGLLVSMHQDVNFDGKVDTKHEYVNEGLKLTSMDLNHDGVFETTRTYGASQFEYVTKMDIDSDGKIDQIDEVKHGSYVNLKWLLDGKLKKTASFGPFGKISESVDSNNDGTLDTHRKFDSFEEITD